MIGGMRHLVAAAILVAALPGQNRTPRPFDDQQMRKLVASLGVRDDQLRERVRTELKKIGETAIPHLT